MKMAGHFSIELVDDRALFRELAADGRTAGAGHVVEDHPVSRDAQAMKSGQFALQRTGVAPSRPETAQRIAHLPAGIRRKRPDECQDLR